MNNKLLMLPLAAVVVLHGCTWVPVPPEERANEAVPVEDRSTATTDQSASAAAAAVTAAQEPPAAAAPAADFHPGGGGHATAMSADQMAAVTTSDAPVTSAPAATPNIAVAPVMTPPPADPPYPVSTPPAAAAPVANTITTLPDLLGHNWLRQRNPEFYTLQLLATRDADTLERFINRYALPKPLILMQMPGGATQPPLLRLLQGEYATRADAYRGQSRLPAAVRNLQPWLRRFESVQQDLIAAQAD